MKIREDILNTLYKYPIEGCPRIYSLLYDKKLLGYGMEYYKEFKPLRKEKLIPVDLKKEYSHRLIFLFIKLKEAGYIYNDFHDRNVLVNSNDLKLIDIDSCSYDSGNSSINGANLLNKLIMSIIFDCDFYKIGCKPKSKQDEILDILYSGLSYGFYEDSSLDELEEFIEDIDKEKIEYIKIKLPKTIFKR